MGIVTTYECDHCHTTRTVEYAQDALPGSPYVRKIGWLFLCRVCEDSIKLVTTVPETTRELVIERPE